MRLFIAEKPQLAQAIAENLTPSPRRAPGYLVCGNDIVTWSFGHLLELQAPEDIRPEWKEWKAEDLPLNLWPPRYRIRTVKEKGKEPVPDTAAAAQIKIITELSRKATSIVHAGDPDDEGQLLVEEILLWIQNTAPVSRVLISDLTPAAVKRELNNLQDNRNFYGIYQKALARSVGDQIFGFNMTRACTLAARAQFPDWRGVLSVGRVQTPVLALIVNRAIANKTHKEVFYYTIKGQFSAPSGVFSARMATPEGAPVDEKGRLSSETWTGEYAAKLPGGLTTVINSKISSRSGNAPNPLTLLELQKICFENFKIAPKQTLELTQILRDTYKAITYNRSDCPYLTDEQYEESPQLLNALQTIPGYSKLADLIKPGVKPKSFNSAAAAAYSHTAIIPTLAIPDFSKMPQDVSQVWKTIADYYVAQFLPPQRWEEAVVTLQYGNDTFTTRARQNTDDGYTLLLKKKSDDEAESESEASGGQFAVLKSLSKGQQISCVQAESAKTKTSPPPLFTQSTILDAMVNITQHVTDPRLREALERKNAGKDKKNGGIGTPATRAGIIDNLLKRRLIIEETGKLLPTQNGVALIRSLPPVITRADLTAIWAERQEAIEKGEMSVEAFVDKLNQELQALVSQGVKLQGITNNPTGPNIPCPNCRAPLKIWKENINCSRKCGFNLFIKVGGKTLTQAQYTALLTKGRSTLIKGMKSSKSDNTFDAYIVLRNRKTGQTTFDFPNKKK